jgi:hypothetical protein
MKLAAQPGIRILRFVGAERAEHCKTISLISQQPTKAPDKFGHAVKSQWGSKWSTPR